MGTPAPTKRVFDSEAVFGALPQHEARRPVEIRSREWLVRHSHAGCLATCVQGFVKMISQYKNKAVLADKGESDEPAPEEAKPEEPESKNEGDIEEKGEAQAFGADCPSTVASSGYLYLRAEMETPAPAKGVFDSEAVFGVPPQCDEAKPDADAERPTSPRAAHAHHEREPVADKALRLLRADELRGPRKTVVIERTECRTVTTSDLGVLCDYVESHCEPEGWTSTKEGEEEELLDPKMVNLYAAVDWIVKPATKMYNCSYAEFLGFGLRLPKWFVSHFWGEAVRAFKACLDQHSEDRQLAEDTAYWVCAYANNQWRLQDEITADPNETSFMKAIELAQAIVTVLDSNGTTYKRLWCGFEVSTALAKDTKILYDIYTEYGDSIAVGITDGIAQVDYQDAWEVDPAENKKQTRESKFPPALIDKMLDLDITQAEASRPEDALHIWNSIAGRPIHQTPRPPPDDEHFEKVNRALRGIFATSLLGLGADRGDPVLLKRLTSCVKYFERGSVHLQLSDRWWEDSVWAEIMSSLPASKTTTSISIDASRSILSAKGAIFLASALRERSHLRSLMLKLNGSGLGKVGPLRASLRAASRESRRFFSTTAQGVAYKIGGRLEDAKNMLLPFNLGLLGSGDEGVVAIGSGLRVLSQLTDLALHLDVNEIGNEGAAAIGSGLQELSQLTNLNLSMARNKVGAEGAASIADCLKQLDQLASLNLNLGGTTIGREGAVSIGDGLKQLRQLASLNLILNSICIGKEGLASIADCLEQLDQLTSLSLNLMDNSIRSEGAALIGDGLKQLRQLTSLDLNLSLNLTGNEGAALISDGLKQLDQLASLNLNLGDNVIWPEGDFSIGDGLKQLRQLESLVLELWYNRIGDDGASLVGDGLKQLNQLRTLKLDLRNNGIGPRGAWSICRGLLELRQLESIALDLDLNDIGNEARAVLMMFFEEAKARGVKIDHSWL